MKIQSMFKDDINRKINGVVKVDQDDAAVLVQELNEYVITKELKKHFVTFFDNYTEAFDEPTADIGVWISGFFGSGKSHFLKMLSYLLENKEVHGVRTVERFREKFADDPATFMPIDRAAGYNTDTILFNIDIEGSINKDKTAVLRVFAKMFYNYLGFYGEDLKVAKLEQFIDKQGKTEDFRRVFEEKNGASWLESRDSYAFFEDDITATLQEVLGMSEQAAGNWFNGTETVETSIAQLVSEIKDYVDSRPDDFRLLFMIDEVGQYVGGDTDLLINLQSLVEKIGSECMGKVWVVCTGQEAIDEIIKARENDFSRIQARFKTRLSLSSSSADEVIQKRILLKTDEAERSLEQVYAVNDSVLRNLFTFTDAVSDIKGFAGSDEFVRDFPFVPYQFILMQKVFSEIRKHGNSGKHLSGGERSMLSGFQEAAQKIQTKDEYALAPFYLFYDTVHTFLDSSIRRVIERCARAADEGNGIEPQDVDVLKLLYLVRYVDDVKSNLDNIVILMANDIRLDKITMREQVRGSLDRLMNQNYIGRTGDTYNFLTDEEQDIQREIKNTTVATADITSRIAGIIFGDIYTTKKYNYGKYNFQFDQMVDGQTVGSLTGGMLLRVMTVATDAYEKQELHLLAHSAGQAVVVLAENSYYESLENAMKIRKYVKQRNVNQLPKSVQDIIRDQQDEAGEYEKSAAEDLKKAIEDAGFYVDGEHLEIKTGDAKNRIDQALEYLVAHVYSDLGLIVEYAETDADINAILNGNDFTFSGMDLNREAAAKVENYLEMQFNQNLPTTMSDVQERFQKKPYGWREIDIAAVVARLIVQQKVTVKYGGTVITPENPKLPDMLRKKTEIGKTSVSRRIAVSVQKLREARDFMRDFFDEMDVPEDEDGLVRYISEKFDGLMKHYTDLDARYNGHKYPDQAKVKQALSMVKDVLSRQKDNTALIQRVIELQDALYDMRDDLQEVEDFFKTRVNLFDEAVHLEEELRVDRDYIENDDAANEALNRIRLITMSPADGKFRYERIPELNDLMTKVKASHDGMLDAKRGDLLELVKQLSDAVHKLADDKPAAKALCDASDAYFEQKKDLIASYSTLALLDGLTLLMSQHKDDTVSRIEAVLNPPVTPAAPPTGQGSQPPKKEIIKSIHRQVLFPAMTLKTEDEIDNYVEKIRANMKLLLKDCDGIKLN
ncbi:MAG: BREX system P-loop protein BrxC [Clostridia bacterium]|nr:BREX system P-loop protein BrxC [Clostridia bacterium]